MSAFQKPMVKASSTPFRSLSVSSKSKLILFFFAFLWSISSFSIPYTGKFPVLQSYTDETVTVISVLAPPFEYLDFNVTTSEENKETDFKVTSQGVGYDYKVYHIYSKINATSTYQLDIMDKYSRTILDSRNFSSINQNKDNPNIAVCSCSRIGALSRDTKPISVWDRLKNQNPDAILFLGDIVYGDNALEAVLNSFFGYKPSLSKIKKRFIQSWEQEKLYRFKKLIPLISVWDDHDYGFDNSDKFNPYRAEMVKLYSAYYPIPKASSSVQFGPGMSYSHRLFNKKIIMLDNRSFLDAKNQIVLGKKQLSWLKEQLSGESEVIITTGIPVLKSANGHPSIQSVESVAPGEFHLMQKIIKDQSIKPLFLTGDLHYSEVVRIPSDVFGFETLQIISSPVKSTSPYLTPPFKSGKSADNPNQLFHYNGYNFALLNMNDPVNSTDVSFITGKGIYQVKHETAPNIRSLSETSCIGFYN